MAEPNQQEPSSLRIGTVATTALVRTGCLYQYYKGVYFWPNAPSQYIGSFRLSLERAAVTSVFHLGVRGLPCDDLGAMEIKNPEPVLVEFS